MLRRYGEDAKLVEMVSFILKTCNVLIYDENTCQLDFFPIESCFKFT